MCSRKGSILLLMNSNMIAKSSIIHYRQCLRISLNVCAVRHKSITGYEGADRALQSVTGGKITKWLDAYEDFVGLTEVRLAQESVTKAESQYRDVQDERRRTQQMLTAVQSKIKKIAMEIEKVNRGTDAYLDLVTKENDIIKEEKDVLKRLNSIEDTEKQYFTDLSSALRESHERERARAERMKYWGIMGFVIGATIGKFGTTVNNYLRMKELRKIVSASVNENKLFREQTVQLCTSVNKQYELQTMLKDTEKNLERKMKMTSIATATLIYTALAVTVPIVFAFFKGSGS